MDHKDCSCERCVRACAHGNPGWFLPGEAEKAAAFLNMSFEDFKNKYLVLDYWIGKFRRIHVWTPIKVGVEEQPGSEVSWGYAFYRGRCTFLTEKNLCMIHEVKPHECRVVLACDFKDEVNYREKIAVAWAKAGRIKKIDEI